MKVLSRLKTMDLLIIMILILAFVLRVWNFFKIPFTFDELSAMSRTTYDSFAELIRFGVVERDSHPAGIQVFLYYWSGLFGETEYVIKLPFILAGLASVYLGFKIGDLWFGKTTGIFTAAYMSSLQLFVMYSQIARPYVSGLFFVLAAVYFWSKYFYLLPRLKYLIGFVVFSILAAYNHYFSLLFVTVLGFSGLILVKRKTIGPYVLSGLTIFLFYIPHLPILFAQGSKGSIGGWLGEPGPLFLVDFLYWLFHNSWFNLIALAIILLSGIMLKIKNSVPNYLAVKRSLLFIWLVPAPLFGYIYSLNVEPILQYSLLIFSVPFLLLLLFSFLGEWKLRWLCPVVIIVLSTNVMTLIFHRFYYDEFYKQPFDQMVKGALLIENNYNKEVFIINDYIPYFSEYYFRKYNRIFPYFTTRNTLLAINDFNQKLDEIDQDIVLTSGLDNKYFQLVKEKFPFWIKYQHGFTYEQYAFWKKTNIDNIRIERKVITALDFNENNTQWKYDSSRIYTDSVSMENSYKIEKNINYDLNLELPLQELTDNIYWFLDLEMEIRYDSIGLNALVVGEIKDSEGLVHWQGTEISEYGLEPATWRKIYLTMDIQNAMKNNNRINNQVVRFYIWNRKNESFAIKNPKLMLRQGNPQRYTLLYR